MTTREGIEAYLQKMLLLYEAIQQQQKQQAIWQAVAEARKEYERCLEYETQELRKLQWEESKLEHKRSRLQWSGPRYRGVPDTAEEWFEPSPAIEHRNPAPPRHHPLAHAAERKSFQKFINRYSYRLRLGEARKAEMNQMAEDPYCPLGAVLIKLDWGSLETFMRDLSTASSYSQPVVREWVKALEDYQKQLEREIRYMELHLQSFSGLAEPWQSMRNGQNHQLWDTIISEARAAKRSEIEKLTAKINALHQEIANL